MDINWHTGKPEDKELYLCYINFTDGSFDYMYLLYSPDCDRFYGNNFSIPNGEDQGLEENYHYVKYWAKINNQTVNVD